MPVKEPFHRNGLIYYIVLSYFLHFMMLKLLLSYPQIAESALILASWSPNISAIIVSGFIIKEKCIVRRLLKGWFKWRVNFVWYLTTLLPVALGLLSTCLHIYLGGEPPNSGYSASTILLVIMYTMIHGASGEELGWRGFALPRLQSRFDTLTSGILVGFMWAFWHIPYWPIPGWFSKFKSIPFWAFFLQNISKSVAMTWIYNNSEGSILIATLFHFWLNISLFLDFWQDYTISTIIWVTTATVIVTTMKQARINSFE